MRPRDRHVLHARYLLSHFQGVDTVSYEFMYLFLFSLSLSFFLSTGQDIYEQFRSSLQCAKEFKTYLEFRSYTEIKLSSSILRLLNTN